MALKIAPIVQEDLDELTGVMTRAFDDNAQKHLGKDEGGPDGYNNGEFFKTWLFPYEQSKGYKAIDEATGKILGITIVWILPTEPHNIIGTIFVEPEQQRKGIATALWNFVTTKYPEQKPWILETPEWAIAAQKFYEKLGFQQIEKKKYTEGSETFTVYVYKRAP
jgi:ribosomal protein S18 acetylase RimI-like enzyme